jgi:hypothetical protein
LETRLDGALPAKQPVIPSRFSGCAASSFTLQPHARLIAEWTGDVRFDLEFHDQVSLSH